MFKSVTSLFKDVSSDHDRIDLACYVPAACAVITSIVLSYSAAVHRDTALEDRSLAAPIQSAHSSTDLGSEANVPSMWSWQKFTAIHATTIKINVGIFQKSPSIWS